VHNDVERMGEIQKQTVLGRQRGHPDVRRAAILSTRLRYYSYTILLMVCHFRSLLSSFHSIVPLDHPTCPFLPVFRIAFPFSFPPLPLLSDASGRRASEHPTPRRPPFFSPSTSRLVAFTLHKHEPRRARRSNERIERHCGLSSMQARDELCTRCGCTGEHRADHAEQPGVLCRVPCVRCEDNVICRDRSSVPHACGTMVQF
jgi:hypothetical protein